MNNEVDALIRRHKELKRLKAPWLDLYQLIGEYIHQLKQDFTSQTEPGSMLNQDLFDSTAVDANTKMTAALIGMLWPSSKCLRLQPPKKISHLANVKAYYDEINTRVRDAFDDPKAGFATTLEEYMNDQGSFGTSAIVPFEGIDSDLSFEAWGIDDTCIAEGYGGHVNTVFREVCWPLSRIIETYGVENLSLELQNLARSGKFDEKFTIVQAIEPRKETKVGGHGNLNMPFRSVHYEVKSKHIIKESGFNEFPPAFGRFYKRRKEVYGRSPGMKALPDILELNVIKEARMLDIEKTLDPPTAVYNDSLLGNQKIDLSPRAINVLKISGKLRSGNPIFPLYEGGNIREADKSIEDLKQQIQNHFNLDRLLDFNNTTEMTLGEAQMRAQLRGESLISIFTRQILVFSQVVERSVAILFRKGRLGVIEGSIEHHLAMSHGEEPFLIPQEVAQLILTGKDFYEIKYTSPATRLMEAEEANGVQRTWEAAMGIAKANPEILDNLDADESLEVLSRNFGAPSRILLAKEQIESIRKHRAQMMEQQNAAAQVQQGVDLAAQASNIKPEAA